jgi:RimJ/RimL family protein N-acetyltransferase
MTKNFSLPEPAALEQDSWVVPILTAHLRLVPFHLENVPEVYRKFKEVNARFYVNPHMPKDETDERNFLEGEIRKQEAREQLCKFVYERETGEFIGTAGLTFSDDIPEIGIWLTPQCQ